MVYGKITYFQDGVVPGNRPGSGMSTQDFFEGLGTPLRNLKRPAVSHAIPTGL